LKNIPVGAIVADTVGAAVAGVAKTKWMQQGEH